MFAKLSVYEVSSIQLVPRWYFICGLFVFFVSCVSHAFASVYCCLVFTWWERADLLALIGNGFLRYFPMWYSESGVVLDCIVSWSLPSFLLLPNQYFVHILLLVTETMLLSRIIGSRRMTVEIISWSISSKIWDRGYLFWGWFLFYNIILLAFFSFAIILLRKRELVLLLYLRSFCPVTIRLSVLCLFLGVLCTRLCLWNFLVVLTSFCGIQYILC